jgi:hypothetical protein
MDELNGLNELIEIPHEFEVDLNCLVLANLRITIEGIGRAEDEDLCDIAKSFPPEERDAEAAASSSVSHFYDELRLAALSLAIVALVTRLQHWIGRFTKENKPVSAPRKSNVKGAKSTQTSNSQLVNQLRALDESLGPGPVPITFFQALVDIRDSVIHHNSEARWEYRGEERAVDSRYWNPAFDRLELTEDLLREAVDNATEQVKWYEERLHTHASQRVQ